MRRALHALAPSAAFTLACLAATGCGGSSSSRSAAAAAAGVSSAATTATRLSPDRGRPGTAVAVDVIGTGLDLALGARLVSDAGAVSTLSGWAAVTSDLARATVPASTALGRWRLVLETAGGDVSTPATFEVTNAAPVGSGSTSTPTAPPAITSVTPAVVANDADRLVRLAGSGLDASTRVELAVSGGASIALVVSGAVAGAIDVVIPAGTAPGVHGLVASNAAGASAPALLTVRNLALVDQPGAYAVGVSEEWFTGADGDAIEVRLHYPATQAGLRTPADPSGGPYPVVVFGHGFRPPVLAAGISHRTNAWIADRLASFGFVVACPDLSTNNRLIGSGATGQENSDRDAEDLLAALDALALAHVDPAHPLSGLLDVDRAAAVGHSRGGDASLMAYARDRQARGARARLRAAIAFAPPATDSRNGNAPLVFGDLSRLPVLLVSGERDGIAEPAEQRAILAQAGPGSFHLVIRGGNHSQFKDSDERILGDSGANVALAIQQDLASRYALAWLIREVRGALVADRWVGPGGEAERDAGISSFDRR